MDGNDDEHGEDTSHSRFTSQHSTSENDNASQKRASAGPATVSNYAVAFFEHTDQQTQNIAVTKLLSKVGQRRVISDGRTGAVLWT